MGTPTLPNLFPLWRARWFVEGDQHLVVIIIRRYWWVGFSAWPRLQWHSPPSTITRNLRRRRGPVTPLTLYRSMTFSLELLASQLNRLRSEERRVGKSVGVGGRRISR